MYASTTQLLSVAVPLVPPAQHWKYPDSVPFDEKPRLMNADEYVLEYALPTIAFRSVIVIGAPEYDSDL